MNYKAMVVCAAVSLMPLTVFATGKFTQEFPLGDCQFETNQFEPDEQNRYFILKPGRELHYNNNRCVAAGDCDKVEELVITVLNQTRDVSLKIEGQQQTVKTRIVRERETANGGLVEISRNFYAECKDTQDVYYFGEEVDIYERGRIVSHDGAWLAGKNRARPGIILPGGAFLLGARYFQEIAPGIALDRAVHVAGNLNINTPAGNFKDCVRVDETTPLDPGHVSVKVYCPGTGLVRDGDLELASIAE